MKCVNMWILAPRADEKLIFKVQGTKFKRKIGPGASLESFTIQGNIFEGFSTILASILAPLLDIKACPKTGYNFNMFL